MRRHSAGNPDRNQSEIVAGLRAMGCRVQLLSGVGGGVPDLLVGTPPPRRVLLLVEVKDGKAPPSARKLRETQEKWHSEWQMYPVVTVCSLEQAVEVVREYAGNNQVRAAFGAVNTADCLYYRSGES